MSSQENHSPTDSAFVSEFIAPNYFVAAAVCAVGEGVILSWILTINVPNLCTLEVIRQ